MLKHKKTSVDLPKCKMWQIDSLICGSCGSRVTVQLLSTAAHHLLELLVRQAVELDDELAVSRGDLGAGVDDLDDVQLLPQAHLSAHLPTQVLDVLHLAGCRHTDRPA